MRISMNQLRAVVKSVIAESYLRESRELSARAVKNEFPEAYETWKEYEDDAGRDVTDSDFSVDETGQLWVSPPIGASACAWVNGEWVSEDELEGDDPETLKMQQLSGTFVAVMNALKVSGVSNIKHNHLGDSIRITFQPMRPDWRELFDDYIEEQLRKFPKYALRGVERDIDDLANVYFDPKTNIKAILGDSEGWYSITIK